jgi:hypothetical protein
MSTQQHREFVSYHMRMWPREIFDRVDIIGNGNKRGLDVLKKPGVYVLYRDDEPYYVGKAQDSMRGRISQHATQPTNRLYPFWNYFSVFVIPDSKLRSQVEAILIAAMPTANNANPKLPTRGMPKEVKDLLRDLRTKRAFAEPVSKQNKKKP